MPIIDDTMVLSFGSVTRRSIERRLAEVRNVKDFGAKGDSDANGVIGTDDTVAIQAAINWTAEARRGTIYFPPSYYKVSAPLSFNFIGEHSIGFRGEGRLSHIVGIVDGFIFDRNPGNYGNLAGDSFEHLSIQNYHSAVTSGCIRWGAASGVHVRACTLFGNRGFVSSDGLFGLSINDCEIGLGTGVGGDTIGIYIRSGGPSFVSGCNIAGMGTGIYADGPAGSVITGSRFEMNDIGVRVTGSGSVVSGCSFEANSNHILLGANSCTIESCGGLADTFSAGSSMLIKTGTGTVGSNLLTLTDVTGLAVGMSVTDGMGVLTAEWRHPTGYLITDINKSGDPANSIRLSKNAIGSGVGYTKTGSSTAGNAVLTLNNTTNLAPGMLVEDNPNVVALWDDVAPFYTIASVDDATHVTLSQPATGSSEGNTFYFGTIFHFNTLSRDGILVTGGGIHNTIQSTQIVGYYSGGALRTDNTGILLLQNSYIVNHLDAAMSFVLGSHGAGYRVKTENCNFSHAGVFDMLPDAAVATSGHEWRAPVRGERLFIMDGGSQALGAVVSVGGGMTFMEVMWNGTAWVRTA